MELSVMGSVSYLQKNAMRHTLSWEGIVGGVYKPRGQVRGEGGYSNIYVVCTRPLGFLPSFKIDQALAQNLLSPG